MTEEKTDKKAAKPASTGPTVVPLLPLRDIVLFPHMVVPLFVGREKSIAALEEAMNKERDIMLVAQVNAKTNDPKPEDIYQVGTLASIIQLLRLPDGTVKVLVEGKKRAQVIKYVENPSFFLVEAEAIDEEGNITDIGNNTDTSVWLPRTHSSTVIFKAHPEQGEWICVEGHIKLNDPGTSNGVEEIWIDGRLEGQRADQNHVGTYTEYGLNQVVFDNYWNRGAPGENVLYRDNIVVSTERIGCLARRPSNPPAAARPVSPTLLP